jgi:hypothetical protein
VGLKGRFNARKEQVPCLFRHVGARRAALVAIQKRGRKVHRVHPAHLLFPPVQRLGAVAFRPEPVPHGPMNRRPPKPTFAARDQAPHDLRLAFRLRPHGGRCLNQPRLGLFVIGAGVKVQIGQQLERIGPPHVLGQVGDSDKFCPSALCNLPMGLDAMPFAPVTGGCAVARAASESAQLANSNHRLIRFPHPKPAQGCHRLKSPLSSTECRKKLRNTTLK